MTMKNKRFVVSYTKAGFEGIFNWLVIADSEEDAVAKISTNVGAIFGLVSIEYAGTF